MMNKNKLITIGIIVGIIVAVVLSVFLITGKFSTKVKTGIITKSDSSFKLTLDDEYSISAGGKLNVSMDLDILGSENAVGAVIKIEKDDKGPFYMEKENRIYLSAEETKTLTRFFVNREEYGSWSEKNLRGGNQK